MKSIDKALSVHAEQRQQSLIDWYEEWEEQAEGEEENVTKGPERPNRKPADPTVVIPRETKDAKTRGHGLQALVIFFVVIAVAGLGYGAYYYIGSEDPILDEVIDVDSEIEGAEQGQETASTTDTEPQIEEEPEEDTVDVDSQLESEAEAQLQLVMDVQVELIRLGYIIGTADGVAGARTINAVEDFQSGTGTSADGEIDEPLLASLLAAQERPGPAPGDLIHDCQECPQLVVIPEGSFSMGSNSGDESEQPLSSVTISQPIAIGVYEVTIDEWGTCILEGGCSTRPYSEGWGRGTRPVMNVSWDDTQQYLTWLSDKTGETYRLPSEAEWEYAARASTSTDYFWGNNVGSNQANCDGCGSEWDNEQTAPAGYFSQNGFGLYDVHGNVNEWVQDCWYESHEGASGIETAREYSGCTDRVYKGGSWYSYAENLRVSNRFSQTSSDIRSWTGFRVVREL